MQVLESFDSFLICVLSLGVCFHSEPIETRFFHWGARVEGRKD